MASDGSLDAVRHRRVGLVVVHGVGETEPGYCINSLLETLTTTVAGYSVEPFSESQRLSEQPPGPSALSYPAVRRRGVSEANTELTAFELHWADLTNIQAGRVNTLLGLFRVIFESHQLVHAMLQRGRNAISGALRNILWIAGWMLRGPIAALTIATSAFCTLLLFEPKALSFGTYNAELKFDLVQLALFCGAVYFLRQIVRLKDFTWFDIAFWLAIITAGLIGLEYTQLLFPALRAVPELTKLTAQSSVQHEIIDCAVPANGGACYVNGLYKVIIWGWRIWGGLLLVCTAILLYALSRAHKTSDRSAVGSISSSIGILVLQFLLWTTVVVTLLYPMLNRAETNTALRTMQKVLSSQVPALMETFRSDYHVSQLVDVPDIVPDWIDRFKFVYVAATMTVVLFLVAAWVLMRVRAARARAGHGNLERMARRMPPLLFSPWLVALLISAFLVVMVLFSTQPQLETNQTFVKFRSFFLPLAALFALVTPMFFGHRIANVVHIARDLIDHHYLPSIETATYFFPKLYRVRHVRPRRARIQGRLVTLLDAFVKDAQFDDVIFVAHSQGSIVAYDYLLNAAPDFKELGGAVPSLLTFGSPLGPIYQKYFQEYEPKQPVPDGLATRLRCWVNLYRVDDYIGGRAHAPHGLRIDNRVMPPGGHTNYWIEQELAQALDDIIQRRGQAGPASELAYVRAMRGA